MPSVTHWWCIIKILFVKKNTSKVCWFRAMLIPISLFQMVKYKLCDYSSIISGLYIVWWTMHTSHSMNADDPYVLLVLVQLHRKNDRIFAHGNKVVWSNRVGALFVCLLWISLCFVTCFSCLAIRSHIQSEVRNGPIWKFTFKRLQCCDRMLFTWNTGAINAHYAV